jgi:hypothetical protein
MRHAMCKAELSPSRWSMSVRLVAFLFVLLWSSSLSCRQTDPIAKPAASSLSITLLLLQQISSKISRRG